MIKLTAIFMVLFIIVDSLALYLSVGANAGYSCLAGGGLMLLDLGGFYFAWQIYLRKKSVALMISITLIKYLLLGFVIYSLTKASWIHPFGLVIGIANLVLAILSMTLVKSFARKL